MPEVLGRRLLHSMWTLFPLAKALLSPQDNPPLNTLLFYLPVDVVTKFNAGFFVTRPRDLTKKTVAVLGYPDLITRKLEKLTPSIMVVPVHNMEKALSGLRLGRYDALVGPSVSVGYAMTNGTHDDLRHTRLPDVRYAAKFPFALTGQNYPAFLIKRWKASPMPI